MRTLILFLFIATISNVAYGQTINEFNDLAVDKEWKETMHGRKVRKKERLSKTASDVVMVFKQDNTYQAIAEGKADNGEWQYDEKNGIIVIKIEGSDYRMNLKVLLLTKNELKVEFTGPDGVTAIFVYKVEE